MTALVVPCLAARQHSLPKTGGKRNGQSRWEDTSRGHCCPEDRNRSHSPCERAAHVSPRGGQRRRDCIQADSGQVGDCGAETLRICERREQKGQARVSSKCCPQRPPELSETAGGRGGRRHSRHSKPVGRMALEAHACPDSVGAWPHGDISSHPEVQGRPGRAPGPGYRELTDTTEPEGSVEGKWPRVWPRSHAYKSGDGSVVAKRGTKVARTQLREGAAKTTQE